VGVKPGWIEMKINNSEAVYSITAWDGVVMYKCANGKWYGYNKEITDEYKYLEISTATDLFGTMIQAHDNGTIFKGYSIKKIH